MKPLSHASYLRLQVLCQSFWDADEKLGLLNNLSLADLKAFIPQLLSQVCDYVENLKYAGFTTYDSCCRCFPENYSVSVFSVLDFGLPLVICSELTFWSGLL